MSGRAIIVTAPSGSGKTTIVRHLLTGFDQLAFSVSATTRAKRSSEVDGVDYHFLSAEQFQSLIDKNGFIEWEEVYPGKRYGSLLSVAERHWAEHKTIVFDVDVKGASRLQEHFGENGLSLFIKAPSIRTLEERLQKRMSEDPASLRERIARAERELEFEAQFDHVILNDDLDRALEEATRIVADWLGTND